MNNTGRPNQISWSVMDAVNFPSGISDVQDAVLQEKAWAVISSEYILLVLHERLTEVKFT